MNGKILLAAFAASVVAFLAGWLIYGILLGDYMMQNTVKYEGLIKDPPVFWAIFLASFSFNLLGAIVFDKWANIRSFGPGFLNGLWIGLLTIIYVNLNYFAFMELYSFSIMLIDVIIGTLLFGVLGGVIGAVLGMGRKKEAAVA